MNKGTWCSGGVDIETTTGPVDPACSSASISETLLPFPPFPSSLANLASILGFQVSSLPLPLLLDLGLQVMAAGARSGVLTACDVLDAGVASDFLGCLRWSGVQSRGFLEVPTLTKASEPSALALSFPFVLDSPSFISSKEVPNSLDAHDAAFVELPPFPFDLGTALLVSPCGDGVVECPAFPSPQWKLGLNNLMIKPATYGEPSTKKRSAANLFLNALSAKGSCCCTHVNRSMDFN